MTSRQMTTEKYILLVSNKHNFAYDYSKTVYTSMKDKIIVVCPKHGEFYPTAGNHKKTGCPACFNEVRNSDKRIKLTAIS